MIDAVIFDLDGTLLDSLQDLYDSTNYALKECGFPERSLDEVRRFVGNGVASLIRQAVPEQTSDEAFEECLGRFRQHYEEHKFDQTKPYESILLMLEELNRMGREIAIVSNKFDLAVKGLCQQYFTGLISVAVGEREADGIRKKPAPDMVEQALRSLGVSKEQAVYVGDSEVDIETAKNSEIDCISVTWGFRSEKELQAAGAVRIIKKPEELLALI